MPTLSSLKRTLTKCSSKQQQAIAVFAEGVAVALPLIILTVIYPNIIMGAGAALTSLWVVYGLVLTYTRFKEDDA